MSDLTRTLYTISNETRDKVDDAFEHSVDKLETLLLDELAYLWRDDDPDDYPEADSGYYTARGGRIILARFAKNLDLLNRLGELVGEDMEQYA